LRPLLLIILLVFATACTSERRLADTFDQSKGALRRGDLVEALAGANRGLSSAPSDSEWAWAFRLLRGEILLLQRQTSEVAPLVSAVVPNATTFDEARARQKLLEARLLLTQNRLPDALASLEAARGAAPGHSEVQLESAWLDGQIRMRLGRWTEAETRLTDVVARAGAARDLYQQARALNDLGMGRVVRGRWDEALQRFERVLSFRELEPFTVYRAALLNAGICYARLGQFDRAVDVQRRAVDLHKGAGPRVDFERALGELGNTLLQGGEPRQALSFYEQALTTAEKADIRADAALWAGNLAAANVALAEWDDAERFNNQAKRLKAATGTGALVHNTLTAAQIAHGRGQFDEATRLFDDALAGAGSYPDVRWAAHAGLARVSIATAQPERAARHFEAALDVIEKTRSGCSQRNTN
jgi:tetratricopeptide (TPR) repeat protein